MQAKVFEIRDSKTFIAALAVNVNPENEGARYLIRRCGYRCGVRPDIILTRLDGNARFAFSDPYSHGDRTWQVAHLCIINKWNELKDGDVIDVEFILGETTERKVSEAVEFP